MNPVLKLLIEGGHLTTAQMAQVAGLSEAEVNRQLEQLKQEKVFLGWRPVLDLSREDAGGGPRGHRGARSRRSGAGASTAWPSGSAASTRWNRATSCPAPTTCWCSSPARACRRWPAFVSEKLSTLEGVLSTSTHFMLRSYKEGGYLIDVPPEASGRLKVAP